MIKDEEINFYKQALDDGATIQQIFWLTQRNQLMSVDTLTVLAKVMDWSRREAKDFYLSMHGISKEENTDQIIRDLESLGNKEKGRGSD